MFEQLIESSSGRARCSRWRTVVFSVAVHGAVGVALIAVPIIYIEVLPKPKEAVIEIITPSPPRPLAPADGGQRSKRLPAVLKIDPDVFIPPDRIPETLQVTENIPLISELVGLDSGPLVALGAVGTGLGPGLGSDLASAGVPLVSRPGPPPVSPRPKPPLRVSMGVQLAKLVHRVGPVYPGHAKAARVSGTVVLQVRIDEQGLVTDVQVLRGNILLNSAAVDAVRQWRYSPTLLNGEPIAVVATVTVQFVLR